MMLSISSTGRISDDDHRVLPALATGSSPLRTRTHHKESELAAPVAVMLWASVAIEVDARLTAAASKPVRLKLGCVFQET
jgi:hypothetical protein